METCLRFDNAKVASSGHFEVKSEYPVRMLELNKQFISKIPYVNTIYSATLINVFLVFVVLLLRKNNLPPEVPLFYGLPQGESQIVPSYLLAVPSLFSIIVIFVNTLISLLITNTFLKKSIIISSFVVTVLSVLTTLKIIFLIGSF